MNLSVYINYDLLVLLHLVLNGAVGAICICRLGKMGDVLMRVKLQYVLLLMASAANGFSPLFFHQWPTIVSIFYVGGVFYMLLSDSYQWRDGAPKAATTDMAPLVEQPHAPT